MPAITKSWCFRIARRRNIKNQNLPGFDSEPIVSGGASSMPYSGIPGVDARNTLEKHSRKIANAGRN
jgi:hypothetical protein